MSMRPTRESAAGRLYLALRKKARAEGRRTDELLQLAALEAFVDRLSRSARGDQLVLKGGVLLAAYDARRPTKDVDLAAGSLSNQPAAVARVIEDVLAIQPEDGWMFGATTAETIREEADYPGVRVHVPCTLASAKLEFHVDVSIGDVLSPPAVNVSLPRLLGGELRARGYPLTMVLAEKIVTALQRQTTNTRWRDFADVYSLSLRHAVHASQLHLSLAQVAASRRVVLGALEPVLQGLADMAQAKWAAWVNNQQLGDRFPADFERVLAQVFAFADPALRDEINGRVWDPNARAWR